MGLILVKSYAKRMASVWSPRGIGDGWGAFAFYQGLAYQASYAPVKIKITIFKK